MTEPTSSQDVSPKLAKVMELARKDPELRLRSLAHVLDEHMLKTRTSRMTRTLAALAEYCRKSRHRPVREQHLGLKRRLQGHFNYFAVRGNDRPVWRLLYWATRIWRKSLSRRSQRSRMTWARFNRMERALPLPRPKLKRLWPSSAT